VIAKPVFSRCGTFLLAGQHGYRDEELQVLHLWNQKEIKHSPSSVGKSLRLTKAGSRQLPIEHKLCGDHFGFTQKTQTNRKVGC
jgi:hypothetical protein